MHKREDKTLIALGMQSKKKKSAVPGGVLHPSQAFDLLPHAIILKYQESINQHTEPASYMSDEMDPC